MFLISHHYWSSNLSLTIIGLQTCLSPLLVFKLETFLAHTTGGSVCMSMSIKAMVYMRVEVPKVFNVKSVFTGDET
jgi:hypothetical protein